MRLMPLHTPANLMTPTFLPPGMAGMPGVNYAPRIPSGLLQQHPMTAGVSPYSPKPMEVCIQGPAMTI